MIEQYLQWEQQLLAELQHLAENHR
jgi:hypothetical protein